MKKFILFILCLLVLTGCGSGNKQNNIVKKMEKNSSDGYHLKGNMSIFNNEDVYKYNVEASFADDKYRVSLYNTANQHKQIILKNKEGVFVLTPALNKSFKFQSEWPHNNSQIYLIGSLIEDIRSDKDSKLEKKDDGYVITSAVDYPNNPNLVRQDIIFDDKMHLQKVVVFDKQDRPAIEMIFTDIDYKATFDDDHFDLKANMEAAQIDRDETAPTSATIEDVLYPMFLPYETRLYREDRVEKQGGGERVLMTFDGNSPFVLSQGTTRFNEDMQVISVIGDPVLMRDGIAALTNGAVWWFASDKEYYLTSSTLSDVRLLEVANSINVRRFGK